MHSGVIAQKVGMTRIFTDSGEHVPVTVLRLAELSGDRSTAPRQERLYSAAARRRHPARRRAASPRRAQQFCGRQGRAQAQGRRVQGGRDRRDPGGCRDHRGPFHRRPVRRCDGHVDWQGLRRRYEALEFRRLACLPRRVDLASLDRVDRRASGPRPSTFRNKKMPGQMGVEHVTTLNLKVIADRRRQRPDPG